MPVTAKFMHRIVLSGVALLAMTAAGCGQVSRTGRAPAMVVINSLEAATGVSPDKFGNTLDSDVVTYVNRTVDGKQQRVPTVFNDLAKVTFGLVMKDSGSGIGSTSAPSALNSVTITRYQVVYRRADGRNTPGVDVPYPFDSAMTVTIPADGTAVGVFELVRHSSKEEAPVLALATNDVLIATVADITFFGRDQAGNDVTVVGHIGIVFGNFGDPA